MTSHESPDSDTPLANCEAMTEPAGTETVDADGCLPTATRAAVHPNLFFAVLWTFVPILAQLFVASIAIAFATMGYVMATGSQDLAAVNEFVSRDFQIWLIPIGTITTVIVAVLVVTFMFRPQVGRQLGWRSCSWQQLLAVVSLIIPLAILASEVTNWAEEGISQIESEWVRGIPRSGGEEFQRLNEFPFILVFVAGCMLPGIGEEIFCRGFIGRGLLSRYGLVGGTLAASFLFGAMHIYPVQACGVFFLGVALQLVFLATRSLPAAIVLHAGNNTLVFLAMRNVANFRVPGVSGLADEGVVHVPLFVLLAAAITTAYLSIILYRIRTSWRLPNGADWSPGFPSGEMPPQEVGAVAVSAQAGWPILAGACIAYLTMLACLVTVAD